MKKCPNGHEVSDNVKYCPTCGAGIISGNKFCTKCGSERKGTEKFCSQCGTPFDGVPSNNHIVINEEKNSSFKKYLPYIIGAVVVLAIIGYFSSKDSKGGSGTQTVVVDSLAKRNSEIEESKPSTNPFVGKVYKGGGNGGGLGINMRITFVDDKECLCVSDWYQAYSTEKQRRCAYDVKGNHVIIHVNDDGNKYDLDFDVKEDGKVLSFDKSDPSVGGSIGNNYMSLEIVDGNATDGTDEGRFAAEDAGANLEEEDGSLSQSPRTNSNTSSSSRTFYSEQIVIGYLANQSFREIGGLTMRVDGDGRLYVDGQYAGVLSVLRYNSTSALLRYGGGMYGEGKLTVQIVGDKFQLKDPTDGTVYYQR